MGGHQRGGLALAPRPGGAAVSRRAIAVAEPALPLSSPRKRKPKIERPDLHPLGVPFRAQGDETCGTCGRCFARELAPTKTKPDGRTEYRCGPADLFRRRLRCGAVRLSWAACAAWRPLEGAREVLAVPVVRMTAAEAVGMTARASP